MLGINDVGLKQTQFYKDVFPEGRQDGTREVELGSVLRLPKHRFGQLHRAASEPTWGLSIVKLGALPEALLDISSREEPHRWLSDSIEVPKLECK